VAEKLGALRSQVDDPDFPHITYRRGASRRPIPALSGTGIRLAGPLLQPPISGTVRAGNCRPIDLSETQVPRSSSLLHDHRGEIDADIQSRPSWSHRVAEAHLHLEADASIKALVNALRTRGHDVTRPPND